MNRFNHNQNFFLTVDRLTFLSLGIFLLAVGIIVRLFWLQIIEHSKYQAMAQNQHLLEQELLPNRGEIYIHDYQTSQDSLFQVAVNKKFYLVIAIPNLVKNFKSYAKLLAPILEMDEQILINHLDKKNDVYEPLKHKVNEVKKQQIEDLKLDGIRFEEEIFRYYPEAGALSQILGFVGYKGDDLAGLYGVEGFWDIELAGTKGTFIFERDALGRLIPLATRIKDDQKNGADVVLTLDRSIQFTACNALKEAVEKYGAENGTVVIEDPKTGAILAMCNWPSYDNNSYQDVTDYSLFNNSAVSEPYESGSMIKGITIASALDLGSITPDTTYEDTGEIDIDGYKIRNSDNKAHGFQTMTQVLEESLNTGAIFAARSIGAAALYQYFKRFGFGEKKDIGLSSEKTGDLSALAEGNPCGSSGAPSKAESASFIAAIANS